MIDILFNNLSKTFLQVDALNKNKFNNLNIMKNFNLEFSNQLNEILNRLAKNLSKKILN